MAGKRKKAPSAAQLANQARFAAMARSNRGAVGFGSPTRKAHGFGSAIRNAFHRISWGVAALSAVAGYFIPSTLSNLGLGWVLYDYVPGWANINNVLWNAAGGSSNAYNPWSNGGLVGLGKLAGAGFIGKTVYDFQKTGKIGQGALNVGIPFALGLVLDGPELSPMAGQISGGDWTVGSSGGLASVGSSYNAQGGVAW